MSDIMTKKTIRVNRANPLIRIPAELFKDIDKRKKKIPLIVAIDNISNHLTVMIDYKELNDNG